MNQYQGFITKITDLHNDIGRGLEFIQWKDSIHKDCTIFIKPNFTIPLYKEGITTTPLVLKEILGILKDRAGRVIIGGIK